MAFNIFDKTRMTVTNSGTGARSLSSITGFATFSDAFGATTTDIPYTLEYNDDWETGFGTFDNGTGQFTATSVDATFVSGVLDKTPASSLNLPAGGGGAVLYISPNVAFTNKIVDGTPIGGTTPAAGSFTTLDATAGVTVGGVSEGDPFEVHGTGARRFYVRNDGVVYWNPAQPGGILSWNTNEARILTNANAEKMLILAGASTSIALDDTAGTLTFSGAVTATGDASAVTFKPNSYLVSTAPSPSAKGAGAHTFITDEVGGPTGAYSDNTNWRRYSDRAIIST